VVLQSNSLCGGYSGVFSLLPVRKAGDERIRAAVLLGPVGANENTSECVVYKAPRFGS
jgi:hypothetical protein